MQFFIVCGLLMIFEQLFDTKSSTYTYIISSGKYFSRILLLSDVNSRIPVILSDSSWPGLAVGKNGITLELDFLPAESEPSLNETVVTSGHGGLLPAGIPVGRVSSITKKQV